LNHDVEIALQSLPGEFKTALLLVDVNELSYEQAVRAMAAAIGTVRSRLSRAGNDALRSTYDAQPAFGGLVMGLYRPAR
jgi:RNA polymerase sigma-70 factor, ECF subfamily